MLLRAEDYLQCWYHAVVVMSLPLGVCAEEQVEQRVEMRGGGGFSPGCLHAGGRVEGCFHVCGRSLKEKTKKMLMSHIQMHY